MKRQKKNLWTRLQDFTYSHKKISIAISVSLTIISIGGVASAIVFAPQPKAAQNEQQPPKNITPAPLVYTSPLTGLPVADEPATKRQVTALILENSPSARPQSGLKDSGLVFEAIAEGGITRYAVLYQQERPQLVGPVRSLRPYYLDWIAPFDASIGHVGGSFNALQTVRNGTFKDIDQFFNGNSYWRATDRVAPHNVYTSFDRLDALNQQKGFTESIFTGFARKAENPDPAPYANNINIPISSGAYNARYQYEPTSNSYVRFLGGAPHTDREAGQIAPKTVVVMKVPAELGFEDGYREQMTTTGHGKAYIFQDGKAYEGFWSKASQREQIIFYDAHLNLLPLNAGQTWISVVEPEKSITWQ